MDKKINTLTQEERRVIIEKGTELPFSGELYKTTERGLYVCKQCDAPLYSSDDKFDSGCGWPSFDDEIGGSVMRIPDADGMRTEIVCASCKGHLGHVFVGEQFTPKSTRHCVNSISMKFIPAKVDTIYERAIFASGCFWGTEYQLQKLDGVIETTVGYTGGKVDYPSYEQVCTGKTGHVEAVEVIFDPKIISYETLVIRFFETHDPTQTNGQGPDIGEQYLSFIFYFDQEQKATSEKLIRLLENKGMKIATQLRPAEKFWRAEKYHRDYYLNSGKSPYCHVYRKLF